MALALTESAEEEEGAQPVNGTVDLFYSQINDDPTNEPESDASPALSNGYASVETRDPGVEGGQPRGGRTITVNGMEFHIFGNSSGLELLQQADHASSVSFDGPDALDSDEEEEEERKRSQAEKAALDAQHADELRRSAPLPAEQCKAIVNAMKVVTLGGYQPDWARHIPEEDWLNRLRSKNDLNNGSSVRDIVQKPS